MNFNGTYLKSFGHCKVLSWKNSVYTDFDRKELVHNGRVLAAVEVPTVRKIEANILVRGGSYDEIRQKLEDIGNWLYSAGTAKLCHETDLTRYFMARCTQVSTPVYSGLSARSTITFTCSDHRLYASYNDLPVESEENNMSNFTFSGKHCLNDMGCLFVKDSEPAIPAVKPHVYEISGMSGTLRYNTGKPVLQETTMSGTLYFVKESSDGRMTEDEIVRKKHEVAAWLINAERATLVMDSDITREYQAEVVTEALLNRKDWANGYLKVKFTVQPVSKSVEVSEVETEVVTIPNEHCTIDLSELVPNGIGHETPLSIKITHKGGDTVTWLRIRYDYHSNSQIVLAHESFKLQESDSVLIDSEDGHVVLEDQGSDSTGHWANVTSGVWCIESGNFPALSVNGLRSLTIKTDAAATLLVEVSCNARWV